MTVSYSFVSSKIFSFVSFSVYSGRFISYVIRGRVVS